MFNVGQGGEDIESISLEYNNVVVMRPWMKHEFFESRSWKLPDDTIVSDGNTPCHGAISAYITSLIVVRNVTVTRKKSVASKPIVIPLLTANPKIFKPLPQQGPPIIPQPRTEAAVMRPAPTAAAMRPVPTAKLDVHNTVRPGPKSSFVFSNTAQLSASVANIPPKNVSNITADASTKYVEAKYHGTTIKMPGFTVPAKAQEPIGATTSGPRTELVTETYNSEGVIVVAYVCKRVPRSPNPDQRLVWGA
jgi:hypothetical protein